VPAPGHGVLFELLNQLEGLAEDSDVLVVLTTNRDAEQQLVEKVELAGLEPATSCMPCKRSPS
jgi:phosphoglycerate dehydrogenase-like enzyme